jgi:uncharacterized membrane protein YhhN
MKKSYWIILFAIILATNLAGVYFDNEILRFVAKPLLVIVLVGYFLMQTKIWQNSLKRWILAALFFSWMGDLFLLFETRASIFFLLGLSAFLMAHIFYIALFHNMRLRENVKSNWLLLLIVVVYYALLMTLLSPGLGDMKLAVRVYGIFLSFMFMLAMHMLFIKDKTAGRWMMLGALLFVVSDSVLAINKFYQQFDRAAIVIMLTYGLAQFFITEGAISYIRSAKPI